MTGKLYRKKPVVIEALLYRGNGDAARREVGEFMGVLPRWAFPVGLALHISTLEGDMVAQPGDYIIKGIAGEFYPCKPDIFKATYEPVSSVGDYVPGKAGVDFTYDGGPAQIEIESATAEAPDDHDISTVANALQTRATENLTDLSFPVGELTVTVSGPAGADPIGLIRAAHDALDRGESGGKPVSPTAAP